MQLIDKTRAGTSFRQKGVTYKYQYSYYDYTNKQGEEYKTPQLVHKYSAINTGKVYNG